MLTKSKVDPDPAEPSGMPLNLAEPAAAVVARDGRRHGVALTRATVKKLSLPAGKNDHVFWDDRLTGFGLRLQGAKKTWIIQYRDTGGTTRRLTVGNASVLEADDARADAKLKLADVTRGRDPANARKEARQAVKFGELIEHYLPYALGRQRPATHEATKRNLETHAKSLHSTAMRDIRRSDVSELHERITARNGSVQANRVLTSLSGFFAWAIGKGHREDNPASYVPKNSEVERERQLSDDEIHTIWTGTGSGSHYDCIVRFLLLTGTRRSEVGSMCWTELDGEIWTVPGIRMKNGKRHEVPLTPAALTCLPAARESYPFVFGRTKSRGYSGWSRSKERLDRRLKLAPWGLHDFRRTMSTRLHNAGVAPHIVEALLAHVGHKAGVAGTYNLAQYLEQKRAALDLWSSMVQVIVDDGNR